MLAEKKAEKALKKQKELLKDALKLYTASAILVLNALLPSV